MNDDQRPEGEPVEAGSPAPAEPAAEETSPVVAAEPEPPTAGAAPAPLAALPPIADGVERPLDPRSVRLAQAVGWVVAGGAALVFLLPALLVVAFASLPGWIDALVLAPVVLLVLALAWSAQVWPEIEHRHASYRVDREGIEIRRGVLWRVVIQVPRSRVQHTDVSQGPLERVHGLGTLVVYTAGTAHAKVALSGIDHGTALAIRDHLLPEGGGDAV